MKKILLKLTAFIMMISISTIGIDSTVYAAGSKKSTSQVLTEVKRGNTMGNLNNGGQVIEKNGRYYFYYRGYTRQEASGMDPEGLTKEEIETFRKEIDSSGTWWGSYWVVEPGIFAVKKDASAKPVRITNRFQEKPKLYDANFMNIYGTYLYYASTNRQDGQPNVICKLSLKGNSLSKQLFTCKESRDEIKKVAVMNDWIYFAINEYEKGTNIYRMRLDGSDKTLIVKNVTEYFDIDGTWLYCFKDASVKRINLINPKQEQTVVAMSLLVEDINYCKGKLYFTSYPDEVGVIPAKAGNSYRDIKTIVKGKLISVENNRIYCYRNGKTNGKLYRTKMNGEEKKLIGDFDTRNSQIIKGHIIMRSDLENKNSKLFESLRYEKQ